MAKLLRASILIPVQIEWEPELGRDMADQAYDRARVFYAEFTDCRPPDGMYIKLLSVEEVEGEIPGRDETNNRDA